MVSTSSLPWLSLVAGAKGAAAGEKRSPNMVRLGIEALTMGYAF